MLVNIFQSPSAGSITGYQGTYGMKEYCKYKNIVARVLLKINLMQANIQALEPSVQIFRLEDNATILN